MTEEFLMSLSKDQLKEQIVQLADFIETTKLGMTIFTTADIPEWERQRERLIIRLNELNGYGPEAA